MSECCMTREEIAKMEDNSEIFYELGLNNAWEAVKKIYLSEGDGGLSADEIEKIFGVEWLNDIPKKFSAYEVIEKLRAYEEKNKIRVGDEVVSNNGDKGIVLCYYHETDSHGVWREEWLVVYMSNYDVPQTVTKKRFKKTGKHYDVMSILKKMKEDEE